MVTQRTHRPTEYLRGGIALASALLLTGAVASTPAQAATYRVRSTADTVDADVGNPACADLRGRCTLRAAIMQANFTTGADTIILPAGTYRLTRPGDDDAAVLGDLDITDDLTIQGAGSAVTIIDGNGGVTNDRVVQILATTREAHLSGMTIRNGKKVGTFDEGGGLFWEGGGGPLVLADVVFKGNQANYGGGLFLDYSAAGGTVDLGRIVVAGNTATAAGGGLGVDFTASFAGFALHDSQISGNSAFEGGGLILQGSDFPFPIYTARVENTQIVSNTASHSGGLDNFAGNANVTIEVINCRLHGNSVTAMGAGIGNLGTLALSDTTLDGNAATTQGGALYNFAGAQATLTDVTVSGNSAADLGGAVFNENGGTVTLTNVTLSGNSAATVGGIHSAGGTVTLLNTLVGKGPGGANCSATFAGGSNLSDDNTCGFGTGRDNVPNLLLGPLANNGGYTVTHRPLAGSPALDDGAAGGAPASDQRGVSRPQGAAVDVGAVEVCTDLPGKPALVAPLTSATGPRITLDWTDAPCATRYQVIVRIGSRSGATAYANKNLVASQAVTKPLVRGQTYFWQVTALGDAGSIRSDWFKFRAK